MLRVKPDRSRNPVFQVAFIMAWEVLRDNEDLFERLSDGNYKYEIAKFDLDLEIKDSQESGFLEKLQDENVTYISMTPSVLQLIDLEAI